MCLQRFVYGHMLVVLAFAVPCVYDGILEVGFRLQVHVEDTDVLVEIDMSETFELLDEVHCVPVVCPYWTMTNYLATIYAVRTVRLHLQRDFACLWN